MSALVLVAFGASITLLLGALALGGPSPQKAATRRLGSVRDRHAADPAARAMHDQVRRITNDGATRMDATVARLLPNPAELQRRLHMTGKDWTLGQYGMVTAGLVLAITLLFLLRGMPVLLALFLGLVVGAGLPHMVVGMTIKRRIAKFTAKFPDAIELLVRGLRSGLPITETMGVVGAEVDGPVGEEFRLVSDRMKIGRTMDAALQETAERLGTPEFQFFVITIAIQRETGGNLAETLSNLADVLRKRAQMALRIAAMSSESKASAYIIGALPFIVFALIWYINNKYMATFFIDERLMIVGGGGLLWMGIGAFIMRQMINFEI